MTNTEEQAPRTDNYIDIVFDGPPGPTFGRFVEVEDATGSSIKFGEWIYRDGGHWALRIGAAEACILSKMAAVTSSRRVDGSACVDGSLPEPATTVCVDEPVWVASQVQPLVATINDLAMLVKRLVGRVRQHEPSRAELPDAAMDFLRRNGLEGSPLRESAGGTQAAAATAPSVFLDMADFCELIDNYQCTQKDGSPADCAHARIALMNAYRDALKAAPAAQAAPAAVIYRTVDVGEIIQDGDEVIDDDCVRWIPVDRWSIGRPCMHVFKTMRRATPGERHE